MPVCATTPGPYNNLNETSTNLITMHALCAYCEQDETSLTQVIEYFWMWTV